MSTGKVFRDSVILERFIRRRPPGRSNRSPAPSSALGPEHPQVVSLQEERATLERMRAALEETPAAYASGHRHAARKFSLELERTHLRRPGGSSCRAPPAPRSLAGASPCSWRSRELWRADLATSAARGRGHRAAAAPGEAATVAVPLVLKFIIDEVTSTQALTHPGGAASAGPFVRLIVTVPVFLVLAYAILRLLGTAFNELRDVVFAHVAQNTVADLRRVPSRTCIEAGCSLPHSRRATGGIIRDLEKGTSRHRLPARRGGLHDRADTARDRLGSAIRN